MATRPVVTRIAPQNDIYTVMLIVAAVFLLVGIIVVAYASNTMYGTLWPPAGG